MIGNIFTSIVSIIDKIIPDPTAAAEAKWKLLQLEQSGELGKITKQSEVVIAEAQSESWIAKNWRPITMLSFVFIIVNNFIISPYAAAFGLELPYLDIPPNMWTLLEIGLGGYIIGRSAEKCIETWKSK